MAKSSETAYHIVITCLSVYFIVSLIVIVFLATSNRKNLKQCETDLKTVTEKLEEVKICLDSSLKNQTQLQKRMDVVTWKLRETDMSLTNCLQENLTLHELLSLSLRNQTQLQKGMDELNQRFLDTNISLANCLQENVTIEELLKVSLRNQTQLQKSMDELNQRLRDTNMSLANCLQENEFLGNGIKKHNSTVENLTSDIALQKVHINVLKQNYTLTSEKWKSCEFNSKELQDKLKLCRQDNDPCTVNAPNSGLSIQTSFLVVFLCSTLTLISSCKFNF